MPSYKAPVDDVHFLLNDVFHFDNYNNLRGFSDASADVREAIIGEAAKFAEEVLQPLNRVGDLEGCTRHADGRVTTPTGFKDAFRQLADGGWLGLVAPAEYGGQGLPATLGQVVGEFLISSNMAFSMYSGLTQGAMAALLVHGTDEQKKTFVPRMVEGKWAGTMNLTEPHCGTDLGLLRTKAVKQPDGSYKISGTKIFISGGEQDLTENIVHLVLARIEGAPSGVRGISLFVVPKVLGQYRWLARREERCVLRLDRAQDGHPRQLDLRDELRQRHRLAGRRGEQGSQRHVRHDERGAARCRRAGAGAVGSRLSERGGLREGSLAGPRADRCQGAGQAGRSDHRASGRAPYTARRSAPSTRQPAR